MNRWTLAVGAVAFAVGAAVALLWKSWTDKPEMGFLEARAEPSKSASKESGEEAADADRLLVDSEHLLDEIARLARAAFEADSSIPLTEEAMRDKQQKAVAAALDKLEKDPKHAALKKAYEERKDLLKPYAMRPAYLMHRAGTHPEPWMEHTLPNGMKVKIHSNTLLHVKYTAVGMSENQRGDIKRIETETANLETELAGASESGADSLRTQIEENRAILAHLRGTWGGPQTFKETYSPGFDKSTAFGVVELDLGQIERKIERKEQ